MPLWRCPHCGTPQSEAARCWVCRRSTTSCATCDHFRRGVAAGLGFCALDRRRLALHGDEIRACWTARTVAAPGAEAPAAMSPARVPPSAVARPARTFVPVDELTGSAADGASGAPAPARGAAAPTRSAPAPLRWSLWGDAEA